MLDLMHQSRRVFFAGGIGTDSVLFWPWLRVILRENTPAVFRLGPNCLWERKLSPLLSATVNPQTVQYRTTRLLSASDLVAVVVR